MSDQSLLEHPVIDGQRHTSRSVRSFEVINPANEEVIGKVVDCDAQHVDDAVSAASEAQAKWMRTPPQQRGERLWQFGQLISEHGAELAKLDAICMGKPFRDGKGAVAEATKHCRYWAGMADKIWGDLIPVTPGYLSYTKREPLGVSGIILPWNGPVQSTVGRIAPALACGNSVVVKPSEFSPLSALRLAELSVKAGMPAGLVNVVTGYGSVGQLLTEHPKVNGISFTGSLETGRKVNQSAARTFKKVVLEMGGKSPNIVFADADLDEALRGTTWGVFYNTGQICCAGTRLLLERSIADEFLERLKLMATRIRIGDPMDESVHMGPLVCRKQFDRVQSYLDIGRSEATVFAGGGRPENVGDRGFFVAPTIFTDVSSQMRIAQEEIFGPVLTVMTFDNEDEALRLANDVEYGLAANIWTSDVGKMLRIAEKVEAGTVWGNSMRLYDPALPYGGFKNSGLGNASGEGAIEGNTRIKRISIRYERDAKAPGWNDL